MWGSQLSDGVVQGLLRQESKRPLEQLLSQEHNGKNCPVSNSVRLKVSREVLASSDQTEEPVKECSQRGDQEEYFEALAVAAPGVSETESPAMVLDVAKGLLDLHAL